MGEFKEIYKLVWNTLELPNSSRINLIVSKHISAKCLGEFKEIHISAKCLGEFKEIHKLVWRTLELPKSSRNKIIIISIFGR